MALGILSFITLNVTNISSPFTNENKHSEDVDIVLNYNRKQHLILTLFIS